MEPKPWHGSHWPEGVPWEISGYQKAIFSLLDSAAANYPHHVYTIFNGATRTFLQVRDAAVGGFNVYPKEVEEVLYTHPKVQLAAVIGLPDPKSGESVKAFVQLKPGQEATEKEILDFCRARMAGYKRPRRVEFRNSIPTSLVGKVLRRVLREEELRRTADSGKAEK